MRPATQPSDHNQPSEAGGRTKRSLRYIWANLDAFIIIAIATAVLLYTIVEAPKPDLLQRTIVALLGVLAFALLRDRRDRDELGRVWEHLGNLDQFVADVAQDVSYRVKHETNSWNIETSERATLERIQEVCFTRNGISTFDHWSSGRGGSVVSCKAFAKYSPDATGWTSLDKPLEFGHDNGDKYIFSLGATHDRGDELEWRIVAELAGRFPATRESVSIRFAAETHQPVMRVVWPEDKPPTHVEIKVGDQPKRQLHPMRMDGSNRLFVEERVIPTRIDDSATIEWVW